jgi:diaminopimelate decarboxylase
LSPPDCVSPSFRDHLRVEEGRLTVEGVSCEELAEEYGTPLYVLSESRIRSNYRAFHGELAKIYSDILVCSAYKANSHLAVCRILQTEGAGAEVVSGAELKMALDSGVMPEKIVFNGPLKTRVDLESAISSGVGLINADSLPELERMHEVARRVNRRCNVGIRVNLGIGAETHPYLATAHREHKFGIWMEDALAAYKEAAAKKSALNVVGIHSHIGSNITRPEIFREMATELLRLAGQVNETLGSKLSRIDVGGGLGFPYEPDSRAMRYSEYASAILATNLQTFERLGKPTLIFEPGRSLLADAALLLTRIEVVKRQGDVNWAITDAGMNTFLRPMLYGARHQVLVVNKAADAAVATYNLGGPCCESADVIAKGVSLPKLRESDLLAVLDVGAYGFTMANNYNGHPRPAVVLVSDGESQLIRRREKYEDLIAQEVIPAHLQTGQ